MSVEMLLDGLVVAMTFLSAGVVLYGFYVCIAHADALRDNSADSLDWDPLATVADRGRAAAAALSAVPPRFEHL